MRETATAEVRLDEGKSLFQRREAGKPDDLASNRGGCAQIFIAVRLDETENHANRPAIWGMSANAPSVENGVGKAFPKGR